MKAITLRQPWATLVAIGAKEIETRSWRTSYRGPIAIHAGKWWPLRDRGLTAAPHFFEALCDHYGVTPTPVLEALLDRDCGKVIAIAWLEDCMRITVPNLRPRYDLLDPSTLSDRERAFGDYKAGRFAWRLSGPTLLKEPVPARGRLGLWEWNTLELAAAVLALPTVAR